MHLIIFISVLDGYANLYIYFTTETRYCCQSSKSFLLLMALVLKKIYAIGRWNTGTGIRKNASQY